MKRLASERNTNLIGNRDSSFTSVRAPNPVQFKRKCGFFVAISDSIDSTYKLKQTKAGKYEGSANDKIGWYGKSRTFASSNLTPLMAKNAMSRDINMGVCIKGAVMCHSSFAWNEQ